MMYIIKALWKYGDHIRNQKSVRVVVKHIKYCRMCNIYLNSTKMMSWQLKFAIKISSIDTDVKLSPQ